ncbi:serine/threonine protein phosphatase, partial [Candidatus Woesearchaeota archaeon]|nr:serine/threonine protein phosphatase [Candidatus Woesearchaeota archaeon]
MKKQSYDLIGDIHGQEPELLRLLEKLSYSNVDGVWQHTER